jgi:hypothetical protein
MDESPQPPGQRRAPPDADVVALVFVDLVLAAEFL